MEQYLRKSSEPRNDERELLRSDKPVMHTFYAKIQGKHQTGMKEHDDRLLLEAWKSAWEAAGWTTKILGVEDAMRYENFEALDGPISKHTNGDYNKFCFYRWMAMATVESGGFMADYDTFPLPSEVAFGSVDQLPNRGAFTVYDAAPQGGIPSLMSGSNSEWSRMVNAITKRIRQPGYKELTIDMLELMYLNRDIPEEHYTINQKIVTGLIAVDPHRSWNEKCLLYEDFYAVHFSHITIRQGKNNGVFPQNTEASDRCRLISELLREWIKHCGVRNHVVQ